MKLRPKGWVGIKQGRKWSRQKKAAFVKDPDQIKHDQFEKLKFKQVTHSTQILISYQVLVECPINAKDPAITSRWVLYPLKLYPKLLYAYFGGVKGLDTKTTITLGAGLAQSVEHATLDFGVMNSNPTLGEELT